MDRRNLCVAIRLGVCGPIRERRSGDKHRTHQPTKTFLQCGQYAKAQIKLRLLMEQSLLYLQQRSLKLAQCTKYICIKQQNVNIITN